MLKLKQLSIKFLIFILFIFSNVQADFFEELYPRKMEAEITPTIEVIESLPQNTEFMHVLGNSQNGFEYYDGIEKISTEFALSYLVTQQNSDGSFGDGVNKFNNTAKFVLLLQDTNHKDSSEFSNALAYITSATPINNIERVLKARIFFNENNDSWQSLMDRVIESKNSNGGYGYEKGYNSDLLTTIEVFETLRITNYNTNNFNQALVYILNKIEDNGEIYFAEGENSSYYLANKLLKYLYPVRSLTIHIGDETIVIQDKINAIFTFLDSELNNEYVLSNSEELVDIAMTYGSFLLYNHNSDTLKEFKKVISSKQFYNGSFGDIRDTIDSVLGLLGSRLEIISVSTETENPMNYSNFFLNIYVKNKGFIKSHNAKLFIFSDNYLIWSTELNSTQLPDANKIKSYRINLSGLSQRFIGNVNFKVYIESDNEYLDISDERWKTLDINFAQSDTGRPAQSIWFVSHNYVNSDNSAGFTASWKNKEDLLRDQYMILYRKLGESLWAGSSLGHGSHNIESVDVTGLSVGETYEIALGLIGTNGTLYLGSNIQNMVINSDEQSFMNSIRGYITNGLKHLYNSGGVNIWGNTSTNIGNDGYAYLSDIPTGSHVATHNNTEYAEQLFSPFIISSDTTNDIRVFEYLLEDEEQPIVNSLTINGLNDGVAYPSSIYTINSTISENRLVKTVDYYYYNPTETTWVFIGSNNGDAYDWFLPNGLEGDGYKIGIIATDYQNNQSNRTESASFEVQNINEKPDVDGNGIINSTDAMLTMRYSLGEDMSDTTWKEFADAGDVDCSGSTNTVDAMLILRYSLGLDMSATTWCVSN